MCDTPGLDATAEDVDPLLFQPCSGASWDTSCDAVRHPFFNHMRRQRRSETAECTDRRCCWAQDERKFSAGDEHLSVDDERRTLDAEEVHRSQPE